LFNFQESDEDDGEDDVIIESEEEELDSGYDEFTWITKTLLDINNMCHTSLAINPASSSFSIAPSLSEYYNAGSKPRIFKQLCDCNCFLANNYCILMKGEYFSLVYTKPVDSVFLAL